MNKSPALEESFPSLIQQHGADRGRENAIIFHGLEVTWAEYATTANQIANRLLQDNIGKGCRVVLLGRNTLSYVNVMGGILTSGAVMVPMPTMATAETIQLMLEDCKPEMLFVDAYMKDLLEQSVSAEGNGISFKVIALDFNSDELSSVDAQPLPDWLEEGLIGKSEKEMSAYPGIEFYESDPFCVMYSSGTTGVPKGIVLGHGTRIGQAKTMSLLRFSESVNIITTPLYSLGAMSTWMPTVYGGGCNIVVDKFDATEFLQTVEKYQVTHMLMVPVQYERLLALPDFDSYDLSSVEFKFGGSAPMTVAVKQDLVARFPGEMIEFYSLTEGGVTTALFMNHAPDKLASVGQASNGCVLKIIDDNGDELPTGEIGEIVGRSSVHMEGYLNAGDLDAMRWKDSEGNQYFRSGDLGFVDEDGYLFLRDRKKDMIISGGMNIYAADIEAQLHLHPDIKDVAVVGMPSQKWGETPVALVVLNSKSNVDVELLRNEVNKNLSNSQRVAAIDLRSELPKNHLGKVLKKQLREELKASGANYA